MHCSVSLMGVTFRKVLYSGLEAQLQCWKTTSAPACQLLQLQCLCHGVYGERQCIPRSTRSGLWFATYWHWIHTPEYGSVEECATAFTLFPGLFTLHVRLHCTVHVASVQSTLQVTCSYTACTLHFDLGS